MLVRKARAAWDARHGVWELRRSQVTLRRGRAAAQEANRTLQQSRREFERVSNCARPKPMSHLDFRVKLAKTLRLRADGVEADDSVCVTPSRRRRSQLGLPTSEEMANRRPSKKPRVRRYHVGPGKLDEVMKEPAVLSLPKRKFVPAKGEKYDLFSEQEMTRFQDGDMIPGVHRLVSIKGQGCQVKVSSVLYFG